MKYGFDVAQDVFELIHVLIVRNALTAGIYKFIRPGNSKQSDIVISVVGVNNDQIQQGIVNVKIHAPNKQTIYGLVPDREKMEEIQALVIPLLEDQYRSSFFTLIETPPALRQNANGDWFIKIVVDYYSIQNDYKNI